MGNYIYFFPVAGILTLIYTYTKSMSEKRPNQAMTR